MRSKEVISYLRLWESIHNDKFKGGEFDTFKNEAGSNTFKVTYQIQPKEGFDPNTLTIPDGEYDENLGWVKDIKKVGVLRYNEKTKTYSIDNFELNGKKIQADDELEESDTMTKIGNSEFSDKPTNYYNLDMII